MMRLDPALSDEGPNGEESVTTVDLGKAMRQESRQLELPLEDRGEAPKVEGSGEAGTVAHGDERSGSEHLLMQEVVGRANLVGALKRVRQNKGSPGIDGMNVEELPEYLRRHWGEIRQRLLAGTYQPKPVRRQEIPKSGGGVRELGIPTVLDRFIQQAILQVMQPRFDPTFSRHSHGFRPGRRAHDAVREAQHYIQEGRRWVVDVDLEKFFDRVNHDVLMGRLAKRIEDKAMLRILRRYLQAGVMANGVVMERHMGTPQGGPLSPLLANVLLDEVDQELELRGHAFVRYADDCNVYVRSRRAGERVMQALEAPVRETSASGQRGKERGGASVGSTVPGLQLLGSGREGREAPGQQEGPDEVQRASPADYKPERRAEPATGGGRATELRAGVEGILRLSGHTGGFPRPGPMDPPPAAYIAITPVETRKDSVPGVEGSRCEREPRLASCSVRAKLVARGCAPRPAHGLAGGVLRRAGCAPAHAVLTSTHRTARCGPACLVVWEGKDRDRRSSPIPIARHALCLERESVAGGGSTAPASRGRGQASSASEENHEVSRDCRPGLGTRRRKSCPKGRSVGTEGSRTRRTRALDPLLDPTFSESSYGFRPGRSAPTKR